MLNILKSDFYRISKNKLFYGFVLFTAFIAFSLMMLIRQDIRIGISVFGDLTAFRGTDDIIRIGFQYYKGLGIFIAIILSVFIGQEYQWKTWQHKWITNKSRSSIYLSKVLVSLVVAVAVFLIYEMVALFCSNKIQGLFTIKYIAAIICGMFIYAAFGSVICLFSMLIKNNIASTIICLCYVLLSETLVSVMRSIGGLSYTIGQFIELGIKHSIYGMSTLVSSTIFSSDFSISIVINSLAIISLSTSLGLIIFHKYEL